MRKLVIPGLLFLSACGPGPGAFIDHDAEVTPFFLMSAHDARQATQGMPEGERLRQIVEYGTAAVQWFDQLQSALPLAEREQFWRRADMAGREPTPERPRMSTSAMIITAFEQATAEAPLGMREALEKIFQEGAVPRELPEGVTRQDATSWLKRIHRAYSTASRFLALYPGRDHRTQRTRDFRPILKVRNERTAWEDIFSNWSTQAPHQKRESLAILEQACAVADFYNRDGSTCRAELGRLNEVYFDWQARLIFGRVLDLLDRALDSRFKIQSPYPFALIEALENGLSLKFSIFSTNEAVFHWMTRTVNTGWSWPNEVRVELYEATQRATQTVNLLWRPGALPSVNAIGGNLITMDQNLPLWLEQSEATMIHEFGHILGFPDCYVEFWSEAEHAFVFYTLDPSNRMCALSGKTLQSHFESLKENYSL